MYLYYIHFLPLQRRHRQTRRLQLFFWQWTVAQRARKMLTMESPVKRALQFNNLVKERLSWARLCGQSSLNRISHTQKTCAWNLPWCFFVRATIERLCAAIGSSFQYSARLLQRKSLVCMHVCYFCGNLNKELAVLEYGVLCSTRCIDLATQWKIAFAKANSLHVATS